jgi:hypothetical protein
MSIPADTPADVMCLPSSTHRLRRLGWTYQSHSFGVAPTAMSSSDTTVGVAVTRTSRRGVGDLGRQGPRGWPMLQRPRTTPPMTATSSAPSPTPLPRRARTRAKPERRQGPKSFCSHATTGSSNLTPGDRPLATQGRCATHTAPGDSVSPMGWDARALSTDHGAANSRLVAVGALTLAMTPETGSVATTRNRSRQLTWR